MLAFIANFIYLPWLLSSFLSSLSVFFPFLSALFTSFPRLHSSTALMLSSILHLYLSSFHFLYYFTFSAIVFPFYFLYPPFLLSFNYSFLPSFLPSYFPYFFPFHLFSITHTSTSPSLPLSTSISPSVCLLISFYHSRAPTVTVRKEDLMKALLKTFTPYFAVVAPDGECGV